MGTNQFQREYIEHLLERNSDLVNKLTQMKENYESKLITKDFSKDYLISAISEILNVSTQLAQDIDLYFDKITDALSVFKNILLRKSEMVQLVDKVSKIISPNVLDTVISTSGCNAIKEQSLETKGGKQGGTLRVSPMINGHVILTEPKIYLSKISLEESPSKRRVSHPLSPIIEMSPNSSLNISGAESALTKEPRVSLERLNLNKLTSYIIYKDSPKSRFKGPKRWKNSLGNQQKISKKETKNVIEEQNELKNSKTELDPLEGPSWLYTENDQTSLPKKNNFDQYVTYKRRKHCFPLSLSQYKSEDSYFSEKSEDPKDDVNLTDKSAVRKSPAECTRLSKNENESPGDIIGESFCQAESRNIFLENQLSENNREILVEESTDENESINCETKENKKNSLLSPKACNSSPKSDSFYDADNEDGLSPREPKNKCYPKKSFKSIHDNLPVNERASSIQSSLVCEEQKQKEHKKKKDSGHKNNEVNYERKSRVKKSDISEDRNSGKENICNVRKKINLAGNVSASSGRTVIESSSPEVFSVDSEGRRRRKAAPINLTETSLKVKLRRD